LRQCAACLLDIADGDGSKRQAWNSGDQALCNIEADSAEAGKTNTQRWFVPHRVTSCGL
jgi:hypothetical protein